MEDHPVARHLPTQQNAHFLRHKDGLTPKSLRLRDHSDLH